MATPEPRAPSTLASWSAAIVRALEGRRIDGKRLAEQAGVDPGVLSASDGRVPRAALTRLWELAIEATGDPAFGLSVVRYVGPTTFHALGYAVPASATLKEAFERLIRFRRLIGEVIEFRLDLDGERYRFVVDVSAPPGAPPAAVDAVMAVCVRQARVLRGDPAFQPLAVSLERPEPPDPEPFRQAFRAPVAFGQPTNCLEFARREFEERLPGANAELARENDEVAVRYLARLEHTQLSSRVQRELLALLPDGAPSKEAVARRLGMSPRNLQRRLAGEGTSFKDLLSDARVGLARGYVAEGLLSVTEIAFVLGFADTSTFSRAFKRWTGLSPRDYAARDSR